MPDDDRHCRPVSFYHIIKFPMESAAPLRVPNYTHKHSACPFVLYISALILRSSSAACLADYDSRSVEKNADSPSSICLQPLMLTFVSG